MADRTSLDFLEAKVVELRKHITKQAELVADAEATTAHAQHAEITMKDLCAVRNDYFTAALDYVESQLSDLKLKETNGKGTGE
jgi:hypothetical protein